MRDCLLGDKRTHEAKKDTISNAPWHGKQRGKTTLSKRRRKEARLLGDRRKLHRGWYRAAEVVRWDRALIRLLVCSPLTVDHSLCAGIEAVATLHLKKQ